MLLLTASIAAGAAPLAPTPGSGCRRPYSATGPWNKPIRAEPVVHRDSAFYVSSLGPVLTSDPTQYTYPVYYADARTPRQQVTLSGVFSNVTGGRALEVKSRGSVAAPIPAGAAAAAGSDAQLIIVDRATGDEWGFWRLRQDAAGSWFATNGYRYNTRWSGVPPKGFGSRGAGIPYLAGLVRPCEIKRGVIDHALAFAYDFPSSRHVWPATKSDGKGTEPNALPEGARLQLDPSLTPRQLRRLGITGPALVVARALQRYGMYVVDASGRDKVMFEYETTARWNGLVTSRTVSSIPLSRFRWVVRS